MQRRQPRQGGGTDEKDACRDGHRRASGLRHLPLAVLPATANAHVDKKHKAIYSSTLKRWELYEEIFDATLTMLSTRVADALDAEQTLIGSTNPADILALNYLKQSMDGGSKDTALWESDARGEEALHGSCRLL